MCNYYARRLSVDELQRIFLFPERPNLPPRTVVRPTDSESVVAIGKDGGRHFVAMRWGLVPFWAKDMKIGATMTNARAETILAKAAFREPLRRGRRCLVPVDGFFEFTGPKGAKQPHYFVPRDGGVLAFAGLWDRWRGPRDAPLSEPMLSYTIATTSANALMAPVHDRMPVLLSCARQWERWLSPEAGEAELLALLQPPPDDLLTTYPVSRDLLKLADPGPELLEAPNSA